MNRILLVLIFLLISFSEVLANDADLQKEQKIQSRIDNIGVGILNANCIDKRVIFVYDKTEKKSLLRVNKSYAKKQIVVYGDEYKYIDNDDELAAYLAREIAYIAKSYDGIFNGTFRTLQMKAAPKKYEIVADKIAVDYIVRAGYNPIALIIYLHKTQPQKSFDRFSNKNLTSKRLAVIYEYIYTKYPYYLANNVYLHNVYYQNFLLSSQENRRMFAEKINSNSKKKLKYE